MGTLSGIYVQDARETQAEEKDAAVQAADGSVGGADGGFAGAAGADELLRVERHVERKVPRCAEAAHVVCGLHVQARQAALAHHQLPSPAPLPPTLLSCVCVLRTTVLDPRH